MRLNLRAFRLLAPMLLWTGLPAQTAPIQHPGSIAPPPPGLATASQSSSAQTALITVVGSILGSILGSTLGVALGDFFTRKAERRAKKAAMEAVYSRYADPISSATDSLAWRLRESLEKPGRGRYLKLVGTPTQTNKHDKYGAYKKLSTLYLLAALLGWIRACRRELSYLKISEPRQLEQIEKKVRDFESTLADGHAVEVKRLTELCALWGLEAPDEKDRRASLEVDLDDAIKEYMQDKDTEEASRLMDKQKSELVAHVARTITQSLGLQDLQAAILQQSSAQVIKIVDIKEAWIYREWQNAIGDLMLRPIERSDRLFEVISFGEFERMCSVPTDEQKKWISRLSAVFDGIDLSQGDPYDYRPVQLHELLRATDRLALATSKGK